MSSHVGNVPLSNISSRDIDKGNPFHAILVYKEKTAKGPDSRSNAPEAIESNSRGRPRGKKPNFSELLKSSMDEQVLILLDWGVYSREDIPRIYRDGWTEVPFFGPLPGENPFWLAETSYHNCKGKTLTTRYQISQYYPAYRDYPPLRTAQDPAAMEQLEREVQVCRERRETRIATKAKESHHEDDAVRAYSRRVFFRCLKLADTDIQNSILTRFIEKDDALTQSWRLRVLDWQYQLQYHMLMLVNRGVKALVAATGGIGRWKGSSLADRQAVFKAYWRQDARMSSYALFRQCWTAVDVANIYCDDTGDRGKWQKYMETIFIWLCEDTWYSRVRIKPEVAMLAEKEGYKEGGEADKKKRAAKSLVAGFFQSYAFRREIVEGIGIGDLDTVPLAPMGVANQNRRRGAAFPTNQSAL
ncbi:MAG: hypothetical protein M1833_001360 [Piccolia ochrophora]|nr:MAG: hypothetical protein M1833_001360 [Piccolia ochrophora]